MYPTHRRRTPDEIRQRLRNGLPCRMVPTFLIETGVEADFLAVYRDLAGLDSLLQAARQCPAGLLGSPGHIQYQHGAAPFSQAN